MKPITTESLTADQIDRINRSKLQTGDNLILDYINSINDELRADADGSLYI